MFYKCQKCKKVWQYPIKKCPECFLELERIKSEEAKVIGVSKVKIPTILHPKTPYFTLVLEDEKGNRWSRKSIKEYKIGDAFVLEPSQNEEAVAVSRVKYDILDAIEKSIALLKKIEILKSSKVLILPTLESPKHPHFSENTSPQFLEAIIQYLIQKGVDPKNIKVASQSFNDIPIEASAQKSQLLQVCTKNKVAILDLSKTNFIKKEKDGFLFEVSAEAFENDLIINLPILKIDSKVKVKGAAENMLKLLKKESYLSLEYLHEHCDLLTKIQEILPSCLTVAEAISIQKSTKYTAFLGLILASHKALNLDRVFAEIVMLEDLPKPLKNIKIEDIPIKGREIEELQYDVEKFY